MALTVPVTFHLIDLFIQRQCNHYNRSLDSTLNASVISWHLLRAWASSHLVKSSRPPHSMSVPTDCRGGTACSLIGGPQFPPTEVLTPFCTPTGSPWPLSLPLSSLQTAEERGWSVSTPALSRQAEERRQPWESRRTAPLLPSLPLSLHPRVSIHSSKHSPSSPEMRLSSGTPTRPVQRIKGAADSWKPTGT